MILGQPLLQFLFTWLLIVFLTVVISLLPFVIRRFRPQAYQGFWKAAGDLLQSPTRALMTPLGFLLGLIVLTILLYGRELTADAVQNLYLAGLSMLVIFLAITISIRFHRLEQKRK